MVSGLWSRSEWLSSCGRQLESPIGLARPGPAHDENLVREAGFGGVLWTCLAQFVDGKCFPPPWPRRCSAGKMRGTSITRCKKEQAELLSPHRLYSQSTSINRKLEAQRASAAIVHSHSSCGFGTRRSTWKRIQPRRSASRKSCHARQVLSISTSNRHGKSSSRGSMFAQKFRP